MYSTSSFVEMLISIGFKAESNILTKEYHDGTKMSVDIEQRKLVFPTAIKGRERNDFYDDKHIENMVVFECVDRLLMKGYHPEHIELEKEWHLGHDPKGDVECCCITDKRWPHAGWVSDPDSAECGLPNRRG